MCSSKSLHYLGHGGEVKGPSVSLSPAWEYGHFWEKDKVLSHKKAGDREGRLFKALHRVWPHGSNALLHSRLSHLMTSKLFV